VATYLKKSPTQKPARHKASERKTTETEPPRPKLLLLDDHDTTVLDIHFDIPDFR